MPANVKKSDFRAAMSAIRAVGVSDFLAMSHGEMCYHACDYRVEIPVMLLARSVVVENSTRDPLIASPTVRRMMMSANLMYRDVSFRPVNHIFT